MDDQQKAADLITAEVRQLVVAAREDIEQIPRGGAVPFGIAVEIRLAVLAGDVITYVTANRVLDHLDKSDRA